MCITKFTAYSIKSQLKNYFIYYYIATFLVFVFFSSDILWYLFFRYSHFLFFSSSDKFLYLSLACTLNFFYHFHNNLLRCLVLRLSFFDNKLNQHIHSFLYVIKKFYKTPLLLTKLEPFMMLIASSFLIYQK